jgi:hypothetical protein
MDFRLSIIQIRHPIPSLSALAKERQNKAKSALAKER